MQADFRLHHLCTEQQIQVNAPFSDVVVFNSLASRLAALLPSEEESPQPLHRAMRYAVLSGGKRLRPRLLLSVAAACAVEDTEQTELDLALQAACAVEYIHAASLVHDDLPIFDDAHARRGRPTVHIMFGEPLAVLAGDALLSRAFEVMAETPSHLAQRALGILRLMGAATGSREGIIGGQSMEESSPAREAAGGYGSSFAAHLPPDPVDRYHAMKSATLFRLAATAGAMAMGHPDASAWAEIGSYLGHALQLADDLIDICGQAAAAGKPVRRDAVLGRPNAVIVHGEARVQTRMWALLQKARSLASTLAPEPRPIMALLDAAGEHFGGATSQALTPE